MVKVVDLFVKMKIIYDNHFKTPFYRNLLILRFADPTLQYSQKVIISQEREEVQNILLAIKS
jgi:hypothetical protein